MLTQDMNDRIARVGPGTPGGELFRRYWLPFMPSAKLDEDPVQPVRLLGHVVRGPQRVVNSRLFNLFKIFLF